MRGWGSQGSPWAWGTVSEVPASTVGGLPRWTVDTAAAEATGPSSCPPRPCLPIARASRVSALPILSPPPPSSPSLLLTLAGLGSGADALPEARPSFLSSPRSVSLLGISVTQPREKVTFGLTLSTWLVETPTSCCARDGRLFCPPPRAKPNPQPRYCHQLHSHKTLQPGITGRGFGRGQTQIQILALHLPGCVTRAKSLNFSELPFPHLRKWRR